MNIGSAKALTARGVHRTEQDRHHAPLVDVGHAVGEQEQGRRHETPAEGVDRWSLRTGTTRSSPLKSSTTVTRYSPEVMRP